MWWMWSVCSFQGEKPMFKNSHQLHLFFIIPEWCNGNYRVHSFSLTTNFWLCRVLSKHQLHSYYPSQHVMKIYIFVNEWIGNKIPHNFSGRYNPYQISPIIANKIGSGETGMHRSGSPSNHKKSSLYKGLPRQGLSEARRAGSF